MFRLEIRLLGEFQLSYDDNPIKLSSPRTQALLTYLILHRTAPQPRYHIAFQLWPDADETQARRNLRYQLHLLRRALPEFDCLVHADELVLHWCAPEEVACDVIQFEHAVKAYEQAGESGLAPPVRAALERGLKLYHGDLLPSCYDDWILPHRERLRQLLTTSSEKFIQWLEEHSEYHAAIKYAQGLLRLDPLHEATYQQLIRLYGGVGDRVNALRSYHACVAVLQRELDIEPSALTRAEYQRIMKQGTAETDPPVPRSLSIPRVATLPENFPNNLPIQLTSFVGRGRELKQLIKLLAGTRLATLTGAGGSGKTRLALEAATELLLARKFNDGVWWVTLESLDDPTLVPQAIMAALGLREQGNNRPDQILPEHVRTKQLLLVLDNCEHLLGACSAMVEMLLHAAPELRVLTTSREPLGVPGEVTLQVPPLSLEIQREYAHAIGAPAELAIQSEAVRLFEERAMANLPTFTLTDKNAGAVAKICQRLDGMPLAIELAAARVNALSVEQIAVRLDDAFRLLKVGKRRAFPLRHQNLQATMDWSYQLLSDDERTLLRRLAVFAGGFTLEAAEAICAGDRIQPNQILDLVSLLVDKSLVFAQTQEQPEARYRLLETVRQYARDKITQSGELETLRSRHAEYFLRLAETAEPKMLGPEQAYWSNQLEQEHTNLRGALEWASEGDGYEFGVRLAGALWRFWILRAHYREGRGWLSKFLDGEEKAVSKLYRAKALLGASALALPQADYNTARSLAEQSLRLYQELGDRRGVGLCLFALAIPAAERGDEASANELLEASLKLWRELGDLRGIATALYNLAERARYRQDYRRAAQLYEEGLEIYLQTQDRGGVALAKQNLGLVAQHAGDWKRAAALLRASLELWQELGGKLAMSLCLDGFAGVAATRGDLERAARFLGAAEAIREETGAALEKVDRIQREHNVKRVRAALDGAVFDAAWAEGRAMTLEQAVEYAGTTPD